MNKRFPLLVFDWDGTLMDSAAAIVRAIQAAAQDLDLAPPPEERARHVIGLGLEEALNHALPELPPARYPQLVERYRHHYLARDHELSLFAGIEQMIADLNEAGFMLAVATGKSRLGLDRALKASGLAKLFHDSRCADECHSKPHPQMLDELMRAFGVTPEATLMIGDTTHDLQMAANAGTSGLAVSYGAHRPELLQTAPALACLGQVADLRAWLESNA